MRIFQDSSKMNVKLLGVTSEEVDKIHSIYGMFMIKTDYMREIKRLLK